MLKCVVDFICAKGFIKKYSEHTWLLREFFISSSKYRVIHVEETERKIGIIRKIRRKIGNCVEKKVRTYRTYQLFLGRIKRVHTGNYMLFPRSWFWRLQWFCSTSIKATGVHINRKKLWYIINRERIERISRGYPLLHCRQDCFLLSEYIYRPNKSRWTKPIS